MKKLAAVVALAAVAWIGLKLLPVFAPAGDGLTAVGVFVYYGGLLAGGMLLVGGLVGYGLRAARG